MNRWFHLSRRRWRPSIVCFYVYYLGIVFSALLFLLLCNLLALYFNPKRCCNSNKRLRIKEKIHTICTPSSARTSSFASAISYVSMHNFVCIGSLCVYVCSIPCEHKIFPLPLFVRKWALIVYIHHQQILIWYTDFGKRSIFKTKSSIRKMCLAWLEPSYDFSIWSVRQTRVKIDE